MNLTRTQRSIDKKNWEREWEREKERERYREGEWERVVEREKERERERESERDRDRERGYQRILWKNYESSMTHKDDTSSITCKHHAKVWRIQSI